MDLLISRREYKLLPHDSLIPLRCKNCNEKFFIKKARLVKRQTFDFCSRQCHNYFNKKPKNPSKPRPELILALLVSLDFPNLQIRINDRTTLKHDLELDLFFPDKQLAVEVNGSGHRIPVYGEDKLKRTKRNDQRKKEIAKSMNITLLTVDVEETNPDQMEAMLKGWYRKVLKSQLAMRIPTRQ